MLFYIIIFTGSCNLSSAFQMVKFNNEDIIIIMISNDYNSPRSGDRTSASSYLTLFGPMSLSPIICDKLNNKIYDHP